MSDESTPEDGFARDTDVTESDPNADGPEGLSGGMGVSSERTGPVRGQQGDATHGVNPTRYDAPQDADALPPEQNPAGPEVQPDQPPVKKHHDRLD